MTWGTYYHHTHLLMKKCHAGRLKVWLERCVLVRQRPVHLRRRQQAQHCRWRGAACGHRETSKVRLCVLLCDCQHNAQVLQVAVERHGCTVASVAVPAQECLSSP